VDQSWPPSVLASLGQLERLKNLAVLKLDCGRQQPVEEMWEGECAIFSCSQSSKVIFCWHLWITLYMLASTGAPQEPCSAEAGWRPTAACGGDVGG
jgi:hypothetical protein